MKNKPTRCELKCSEDCINWALDPDLCSVCLSMIANGPTMLVALKYALQRYPKLAGSIVEFAINEAERRDLWIH